MKRLTDTEKWRDPWFFGLDAKHKFLWLWLCDRVDNAGVVDIQWKLASMETGFELSEHDMEALGDRVNKLPSGKWNLTKFVHFQFGTLSEASRVHQSVGKLLQSHSLPVAYPKGTGTTKDKDKDKDKDSGESEGREELRKKVVEAWNATGFPKCMKMTDDRRAALNQRLSDPFWRDNWAEALERIRASKFCNGENNRKWVADFEFFCRPDTVVKAMEGKYGTGGVHINNI